MSKGKMIDLLDRYGKGELTPEEQELVDTWFDAHGMPNSQLTDMSEKQKREWIQSLYSDIKLKIHLEKPVSSVKSIQKHNTRWWPYFATAAASAAILLLLFNFGNFIWNIDKTFFANTEEIILPISNRATITINGKSLPLREDQTGIQSIEGSIIYQEDQTELVNIHSDQFNNDKLSTNLIKVSTPRAGMYQVILPDKSKAWLNAASTITFPSKFADFERVIEISGEVYLDVYSDIHRPFIVKMKGQEIEVLGTSFNVIAYHDDEGISTTLVEGKLRIRDIKTQEEKILIPGQQAFVNGQAKIRVQDVDPNTYVSWKSGVYFVDNETLLSFAKKIERWYDVEISLGNYGNRKLSAIIRRDVSLGEVISAIELQTDLKFTIEGRRVVIKE